MSKQMDELRKDGEPMEFFPRMTTKVRGLMVQAEAMELRRIDHRGPTKTLLMLLIWDNWLKITDDPACDIRLTPAGRRWLMRDRLCAVEKGL